LYQITSVTLSCDCDEEAIIAGNKSHGSVTSSPVAVCTSDNGPETERARREMIFHSYAAEFELLFAGDFLLDFS
jgi:hypothetical protein